MCALAFEHDEIAFRTSHPLCMMHDEQLKMPSFELSDSGIQSYTSS